MKLSPEERAARDKRREFRKKQAAVVAKALVDGSSKRDAARLAGYSPGMVKAHAGEICRGKYVVEELVRIGESITSLGLHSMGKARLQMMLSQKKLDPRTLIAAIRTAAELDGKIGARAELNINTQQNFFGTPPPQAALIMARRFKEILAERIASGETMKGSDEEISFLKEITKLQVIGAPALEAQRILPRGFQESATPEESAKDYV